MIQIERLDVSQVPKEVFSITQVLDDRCQVGEVLHSIEDWKLWLTMTLHHRLFPVVYSQLRAIQFKGIPDEIQATLNKHYQKNVFRMLALSAEMSRIQALFDEHNIRVLSLKGPVLGIDLYGDMSLRSSSDLDVMVSLRDLVKVEHLLEEQGYVKDEYIQSVLNDWKWRHHHFTYLHPDRQVKVEVHWRLNPGPGKEPTFEALWQRKRTLSNSSGELHVLSREDLFLFLITHGARHGWSRLRWLHDIDRLVRQGFQWDEATALLKKYSFEDLAGQALLLCEKIFNTPLPSPLKQLCQSKRAFFLAQATVFYLERRVNLHQEPVPEDIASYHKVYLRQIMNREQRLLYVVSVVHPFYTDVETLPLPKQLHFLYFPLRPFLFLWRKVIS
ncbi:hypothetical protein A374_03099 [Fictibacillus macauensis ZFHKF-1]|uniref:Renal dipeptidase n=1 Tax=Fictibacillus macauensis ZFHKF-1 TaxID=1196324 RepID=I8ALN2_9BACL|nr:nucleotidyltransferase family protein [Fictibacillus macauensis]EIT86524.1 hypothetical protein A374_03099 [Fictibacillus macauensis ZFHKF-1]